MAIIVGNIRNLRQVLFRYGPSAVIQDMAAHGGTQILTGKDTDLGIEDCAVGDNDLGGALGDRYRSPLYDVINISVRIGQEGNLAGETAFA